MSGGIQYLLDGVDLEDFATSIITLDSDLPVVGTDNAVPYRPGETFRRRNVGSGDVQLGVVLGDEDGSGVPGGVSQWLVNWTGLKALVWKPGAVRTLTRRLTLPSGVVESSSKATLVGLPQATMAGPQAASTVLDFKLLDGYLYGTTDITVSSPGMVTVDGDARTYRVVVTMTAGTLTNTTTGATLIYAGTGTAVIDVLNWTASNGADVSGDVSWPVTGHDFWFDLDPGSNVLTGSASIVYRPAYLP